MDRLAPLLPGPQYDIPVGTASSAPLEKAESAKSPESVESIAPGAAKSEPASDNALEFLRSTDVTRGKEPSEPVRAIEVKNEEVEPVEPIEAIETIETIESTEDVEPLEPLEPLVPLEEPVSESEVAAAEARTTFERCRPRGRDRSLRTSDEEHEGHEEHEEQPTPKNPTVAR